MRPQNIVPTRPAAAELQGWQSRNCIHGSPVDIGRASRIPRGVLTLMFRGMRARRGDSCCQATAPNYRGIPVFLSSEWIDYLKPIFQLSKHSFRVSTTSWAGIGRGDPTGLARISKHGSQPGRAWLPTEREPSCYLDSGRACCFRDDGPVDVTQEHASILSGAKMGQQPPF